METIFTITTEDMNHFDQEVEAVKLWQELLWAEAYRINLPLGNVNITEKTKVADGGVDAIVQKPSIVVMESSLFPDEFTSYQIKAGPSFQPWQEVQIRNELFGKNKPAALENLGHMVRDCLERNSTYILVCFGHDLTSDQREKAITHLKNFLGADCGYADPKVDVWSRNNIISFLQPFPALALQINRRPVEFQTHASWCNNDGMQLDFTAGQQQQDKIEELQQELLQSTSHIRVVGEAGIGKTRLVLEATGDAKFSPFVIYTQASTFVNSPLMYELMQEENLYQAILVVDECDPGQRADIVWKFRHIPHIRLITVYNDHDNASEVVYIDVPALSGLQVEQIIKQYHHSSEVAQAWVNYCSGSPRVAHAIGDNLKNNPDDMFRTPDSVNLWERYIAGTEDPYSDAVQRRYLVLRYLALFKRFGYTERVQKEARTIQQLIAKDDPNITWGQFVRIIQDLRQRKILQGEYTLYITPKMLHIKLWIEWWETYGSTFAIEEILTIDSPPLLDWFFEMFEYAVASETAMGIVNKLLGPDGPFQQNSSLLETERGARFFRYLGEVAPQTALKTLEATMGKWSKEKLQALQGGRRQIVWLLEKTVQRRASFIASARLLLALGEAETEPWSNNASNLFTSLFYLSRIPDLSPTEAPPAMRLPILRDALASDSHERRMLGIAGCGNAVTQRTIVNTIIRRPVPFGPQLQLWSPNSIDELHDAISEAWQILTESLDTLSEIEKQTAINVLIDRISEVGSQPPLDKMVIETIQKLIRERDIHKKAVLNAISKLFHPMNERLKPTSRKLWEDVRDQLLVSNNYHDRIRRYIGLDVDRYGDRDDVASKHQQSLEQLAVESLEDRDKFCEELDWLVTVDARYGYHFGIALAEYDTTHSLLAEIVDAQQKIHANSSFAFLTGYLTNLPHEIREQELNRWMTNSQTMQWISEVERVWPLSQHSVDRLLQLVYNDTVPMEHLRFWMYRDFTEFITEATFTELIKFLINSMDEETIGIVLGLYETYFVSNYNKHTLPSQLTLQILTHQIIATPYADSFDKEASFHWREIATEFVSLYPSKNLALSEFILEYIDVDNTILEHNHSGYSLWQMIFKQYPEETWKQTVWALERPHNFRLVVNWNLRMYLRYAMSSSKADDPTQPLVPADVVWSWVEEDIDERPLSLASFIPFNQDSQIGEFRWDRELLIRYGQREDVRNSLHSNFSSGSWIGPRSLHYIQKRQRLMKLMQNETEPNVLLWLQEHISQLEPEIKTARQNEERFPV